jgi:hypothetical protein
MAGDQETREVYAATAEAVAESIRITVTLASLLAESLVRAREERLRREGELSEARAQAAAEELRAARAEAEPLLRSAWQEAFWERPDPRRIGLAWQAAAEWAELDPYAQATLDHLRHELKDRLGIEVPTWPIGGAELARLTLLADPAYRKVLKAARDAAAGEHEVSYVVIIRDTDDPHAAVFQDTVTVHAGMDPHSVAARVFLDWAENHPETAAAPEKWPRFAAEAVENTDRSGTGHVPAAVVSGATAKATWEQHKQRIRDVAAGREPASDIEQVYALTEHLRALEERADPADEAARTEMSLRLSEAYARSRGENPAHVRHLARLVTDLDGEWWRTASAPEIAAVWKTIADWSDSRARTAGITFLQDAVRREHGIDVPPNASHQVVREALSGRADEEPALPVTAYGRLLYQQARELYDRSFNEMARAVRLDAAARHTDTPEEERVRMRREAQELRESAGGHRRLARDLNVQGYSLEVGVRRAVADAFRDGTPEPLLRLYEEFTARWGRTPGQAAAALASTEAMAEAAAAVDPEAAAAVALAGRGRKPLTATDLDESTSKYATPPRRPVPGTGKEKEAERGR